MSLLAELCTALADRPRARRLYELLAPYEGRNVVSMGAAYLGPVARYLGLLAMTLGEDERALGHLETARSAAQRMGAKPTVVLTALDAAEVLARRAASGDAQRGRALVQGVAVGAAQMQMNDAVARADQLLARLEEATSPARRPGARPSRAALRHEQDVWLLDYDGRTLCLQDAKGLHHLATLLEQPGTPVSAVRLAHDVNGGDRDGAAAELDAHHKRALDLREELAEAQSYNDPERVARARHELERLAADMARADGMSSAAGERARINVTRAIKTVVRHIAEHEPELGHRLRGSVRTGTACTYEPDPGAPLLWEVRR